MRTRRTLDPIDWALAAVVLCVFLWLIGACASSGAIASRLAESQCLLTVDNGYRNDVRVWILHEGTRGRALGTVASYTKSVFALRASDTADGTLQLLAIAYLDDARFYSERVPVARGQSAELDIRSGQQQSFLWPRARE